MQKMAEWSVEANRIETTYLDKKVDYTNDRTSAYLEHIIGLLRPNQDNLLQTIKSSSSDLLAELTGFAEKANFGEISKLTARHVLQDFVGRSAKLNGVANISSALLSYGQLRSLHEVLKKAGGGLSRAQAVGKQLVHETRVMQTQAKTQLQVLGIYRQHSRNTHQSLSQAQKHQEKQAKVQLDHVLWQIRLKLDQYLDIAEEEVTHFQHAFEVMGNYEGCTAGFSNLLETYATSMAFMDQSHRQLRSTWIETANLFGELAAVIDDGGVFENCQPDLSQETLRQVRSAMAGIRMLSHRFRAAGLGEPSSDALVQAARRIQKSFRDASYSCQT